MQPDSECNKRIRAKPGGTPKDSTPTQKTGNLKKTSTLLGNTPTSSTNKKKTDISQFFKKIEKPNPISTSKADCDINGTKAIADSPATLLLNRIQLENYTPLNNLKSKTVIREADNKDDGEPVNESSKGLVEARKTLDFVQVADTEGNNIEASIESNIVIEIKTTSKSSVIPKTLRKSRRHSLVTDCEIETATISMNTMAISVASPSKRNRRRSSIHTPQDMSLASETSKKVNNMQAIPEEINNLENNVNGKQQKKKSTKSINRRRTLYAAQTMEQTGLANYETERSKKDIKTANKRSSRRRTLYARETMETTELNNNTNNSQNEHATTTNTRNRRRTCLNLKTIEQTEISTAIERTEERTNEIEMNTPKIDKTLNARRTVYGVKSFNDINTPGKSPNMTSGSSICFTPNNFQKRSVISSTLLDDNECDDKLMATPTLDATAGKLVEDLEKGAAATPLIFSSTRKPGNNRRTLFDVSMDIITQRLQCINQSARRSLAPPTPAVAAIAEADKNVEEEMSTPINLKKTAQLLNNDSSKKSSKETIDECADKNDTTIYTPEKITMKKRRKLFMPNEMAINTPPTAAPAPPTSCSISTHCKTSEQPAAGPLTPISSTTNSVNKRRRTLMPISQPQPTTMTVTLKERKNNTAITPTVRKRRSTLDFEQVQNINTKLTSGTDKNETKKAASQLQLESKKACVLVYTNMHQQQIDVIREAIDKLGSFKLESRVTNSTTHLVSLEPRRTLNLLKALVRGLWILDYSWIVESLKIGKWLPEESHELKDFSRAVEVCRSERQAFGSNFKCDLLCKMGSIYISSKCFPISKENMCDLISLCGGHIVNNRQKARYIIGDSNRTLEDKLYLTPYWILDSITQMQIMKINKYLYPPITYGQKASQPIP